MKPLEIVYLLAALVITLPIVTVGFYKRKNWLGIALCLALSLPAWWIGQQIPLAGGPVIGILLGLIIANLVKLPVAFAPGIKDSSKRILQMAIVLFGFQMNLASVFELGGQALILIAATISVALLVAFFVGKALGFEGNERTLIGVGTAICGGSAIAAVSPIIQAKDEEVVRSISTIFLFNVIAAFAFPLVGHLLGMSDLRFGMWAGSAINDTSSVVAAGYAYSEAAGGIATIVKLTRTLMIVPVCLFFAVRQSRSNQGIGSSLLKSFPWFVAAFLVACIINTTGIVPAEIAKFWATMGKYCIVIAMVAIGLSCNIRELVQNGSKPILLGLCCSVSVALVSLALQFVLA